MQGDTPKINNINSSRRYVLAIDLGSGGPKAAVVSDAAEVLASAYVKVATTLLPLGGAEQSPEEWWTGVKTAARKAVKDSDVSPGAIEAVTCDSQWSVVVPIDEEGRPLMNAVHWLDTRGGVYNRALIRGFPSIKGYGLRKLMKWIRLTGLAPTTSGIDSLGHILFIKHELPDIYEKTYKFLEPVDYLNLRLTGRCTATQETMIPMLVVDCRRWSATEYHEVLLKYAGLTRDKLPDLVPNKEIIGTVLPSVAEEIGISPDTRVIAGSNDTNASAIGSGAVCDYEGIIYIGTSLVLTCHLPWKKTDLIHTMTTMPSPLEDRYLLMAEQGTGGKALEFYLKNLVYAEDEFETGPMPADAYERANRIAASVPPGSGGVIFMPWLNGTIAPDENVDVRGGFFNMSLSTTRGHLTRSVMEGLAFNNRWAGEIAEKFIGRKFDKFRFAGGGAFSDEWAQIHADILGVPIHQVEDPAHTTVRGAALLAFDRLGIRATEEFPSLIKIKNVFEPNPANRGIYDKMFHEYRQLFVRNKKIFAALNRDHHVRPPKPPRGAFEGEAT
jgi:xylulokinase